MVNIPYVEDILYMQDILYMTDILYIEDILYMADILHRMDILYMAEILCGGRPLYGGPPLGGRPLYDRQSLYSENPFTATQLDVINDVDVRKATSRRNIPSKTFKQNIDLYVDIITNMFNNSITECNFPDLLKLADITPAFKKGDVTDKGNYRPISLLPCVSKLFEKLYSVQISVHMEQYFSKY